MKIKSILLLIFMVLVLSNCTVIPSNGKKHKSKKYLKKVLIVSRKNRVRDPVFSKVENMLKKDGHNVFFY
ncbi:MAG: hypothetical protein JW983_02790 [Elusimicrobia bacterium]|nr:hypothetical protein [Elusimicrobiota bacterium]